MHEIPVDTDRGELNLLCTEQCIKKSSM